jgi:nicotinamidase/pyrazinamidase
MRKALLVVDVQNDFCPGGSYPVPNGNEVVGPLNEMIAYAKENDWFVAASRDWHPEETKNLEGWTPHCIKNTKGAKYHPKLKLEGSVPIINKGETWVKVTIRHLMAITFRWINY